MTKTLNRALLYSSHTRPDSKDPPVTIDLPFNIGALLVRLLVPKREIKINGTLVTDDVNEYWDMSDYIKGYNISGTYVKQVTIPHCWYDGITGDNFTLELVSIVD